MNSTVDLTGAPRAPQHFLYFLPLPQGQGAFRSGGNPRPPRCFLHFTLFQEALENGGTGFRKEAGLRIGRAYQAAAAMPRK
jgi:hypothetical protein